VVDALVLAWVVLWIVAGVTVAGAVKELTVLSDTVTEAGRAVRDSGQALGSLRDLPLVGERLGAAAGAIVGSGLDVVEQGRSAEGKIVRAANLLGVAVAALALAPVLAAYLPARLARAAELREVRRLLADGAGDPALERLLARRAAVHLSYRELARVSPRPWADLEEGRTRALAEAELRRVGLGRRALDAARAPH
jgi:hypothetical protein